MFLLQFHFDQSGFVFVLRQDYVVPLVLQFFDLQLVGVFQRFHFLSLQSHNATKKSEKSEIVKAGVVVTYMAVKCFIFSLLFFEDAKLLEALPSEGCLA